MRQFDHIIVVALLSRKLKVRLGLVSGDKKKAGKILFFSLSVHHVSFDGICKIGYVIT